MIWKRKDRDWQEYPAGTIAREHSGFNWVKQDGGSWKGADGKSYAKPYETADEVIIP